MEAENVQLTDDGVQLMDNTAQLVDILPPNEENDHPMAIFHHDFPPMNARATNTLVHERQPENSIHYISSNKEFCSEIKDNLGPLRFDIRPRMFGNPKSNRLPHGEYCSEDDCHSRKISHLEADVEGNINLSIYASKRREIEGEFPDDCLTIPPKFHNYATRVLESIKILPPTPGNELKMVFNDTNTNVSTNANARSKKHLIVDKSFALYHCGVLAGIIEAESIVARDNVTSDDVTNDAVCTISFKEVDYNTMKHIFLILYNPGTYFSEPASRIRILRGNRLHKILVASHMLEFRNIRTIISSAFKINLLDTYKVIYDIYRDTVDVFIRYWNPNARMPRGMIMPPQQLPHADNEEWDENINKQKSDELVEKFRSRTNMAARYEIISVSELFSVISSFMPELTIPFMTTIVDMESLINDNQNAKKIYAVRVGTFGITIDDMFDLLNEVKPDHKVTIQIIKYLVSVVQKNPLNKAIFA